MADVLDALLAEIKKEPSSAKRDDIVVKLLEVMVGRLQRVEVALTLTSDCSALAEKLAIATSERLAELEQQLSAPVTIGVSYEKGSGTCP